MARFTLRQAEESARRYNELTVEAVVDTGAGSGFLLTSRGDSPSVLGVAAIDVTGGYAPVGMDAAEVQQLRDALTAWLEQ